MGISVTVFQGDLMTLQKFTVCALFLLLVFTLGVGIAHAACDSEYYIGVDRDAVAGWIDKSGIDNIQDENSCSLFTWYAYESVYSMANVSGSLAPCTMESLNDLQWQFYWIMVYSGCWQ
jgi:hypothetical protein